MNQQPSVRLGSRHTYIHTHTHTITHTHTHINNSPPPDWGQDTSRDILDFFDLAAAGFLGLRRFIAITLSGSYRTFWSISPAGVAEVFSVTSAICNALRFR